uniref:hydroxymethylpyrimidine kinase n=1 Tax=uncultured bacterium fosmid pJB69A5 TaxID=1478067 RepID=A0A0H3U7X9_9BACT|nr:putative hydroxymethylpyrimidine/phosphomethylpyrimidine kinase [uncultured bacterium fosmid pJB69A5]
MKSLQLSPILSITGSDSTGQAGIQADIRTASDLGAYAVTVITAITVQNRNGIRDLHFLPSELVVEQTKAIFSDLHPKAVKIGMLGDERLCRELRGEVIGCRHIVLDPGFLTYLHNVTDLDLCISQFCRHLIPIASLLMLKCAEAEIILHKEIHSDDDMIEAAKELADMGAEWVFLRGSTHAEGRLTALLYGPDTEVFYSSINTEGWQKHGVGGALSTAITTRLSLGDDMLTAITKAHEYLHHQIVYSVETKLDRRRPAEIYNEFLSLIASHYSKAHNLDFYADKLCITPRYLSMICSRTVQKSPKQIIDDYLIQEANTLLSTSGMTIQEITIRLGFSSQAAFSRFYKNQMGVAPSKTTPNPSRQREGNRM